jgi:hypothetical protein
VSSWSCGTGATLSYNGSSYVCTYTATPTCSNGGYVSGLNCLFVSSTTYASACVSNGLGTASWQPTSYDPPWYGYCTWTQLATQTCPSGGSSGGTTTCTYAATPNYSYYWACPLGGTASGSICSISGGSGPNIRGPEQKVQLKPLTRVRSTSSKGSS